mmetsp:Transcript_36716/g.86386  ORF Transcript_36716/g.86386 Transcript_36716/m.86386 type:complete len:164 (-) Transcript_36716:125-616(-)|eukprot:768247-Rhodomonas_salina.2
MDTCSGEMTEIARPDDRHFVCDPMDDDDDSLDLDLKNSPSSNAARSDANTVDICSAHSAAATSTRESVTTGSARRDEDGGTGEAAEASCRSWMSLPMKSGQDKAETDSLSGDEDLPETCGEWMGKTWSVQETLVGDVKASTSRGVCVSYLHTNNGSVTPLFTM